ncbi:glycosyltransferase [Vibrio cholerae]|nr:glycosyltransferase [Vibrio cholerae]
MKKNDISIIVASSANAGLYARFIKIFHNCRVIYVSHGWSCIYNGGRFKHFFIFIERILSYLSDYILCVSKKDSYNAISSIKISKSKIVHIRNCVFPRRDKKKYSTDISFKILFLGRLSHPKRPDLLIEAVKNFPNVTLDIIGDGPLRDICNKYDNVNFLGMVENFDNFSDYDIFALISDSEGMPMSALEAASSGMPLLLSDVGGCSELVMGNGLLVKNSVDNIVIAIDNILRNYTIMKSEALKHSDDFDIYKSYLKYKNLYSGVDILSNGH